MSADLESHVDSGTSDLSLARVKRSVRLQPFPPGVGIEDLVALELLAPHSSNSRVEITTLSRSTRHIYGHICMN